MPALPTPLFWSAADRDEVEARRGEYVYPLVIKPLYSHRFQRVFGDKFFRVEDFDGLLTAYDRARAHDLEVVLLEEIPGPDDRLCSYYTYIDEGGEPLADFTKRIIRRYPENRGLACYHVTDWNPEVRDLGLRLFRHVGLRGVGERRVQAGPPRRLAQGDRVQCPLHCRQSRLGRERLRPRALRLQPSCRRAPAAAEGQNVLGRAASLVPPTGRPRLSRVARQRTPDATRLARKSRPPAGLAVLQLG